MAARCQSASAAAVVAASSASVEVAGWRAVCRQIRRAVSVWPTRCRKRARAKSTSSAVPGGDGVGGGRFGRRHSQGVAGEEAVEVVFFFGKGAQVAGGGLRLLSGFL